MCLYVQYVCSFVQFFLLFSLFTFCKYTCTTNFVVFFDSHSLIADSKLNACMYVYMYVWAECTPWGSIDKVSGYQYNCDPSIQGRYKLDSFWDLVVGRVLQNSVYIIIIIIIIIDTVDWLIRFEVSCFHSFLMVSVRLEELLI